MTLEELAARTAPLPRRARLDFYFIGADQVTDTQGDPLTRDELAGLAERISDHTQATPGALPALPVTVEIHSDLVHAGGRALVGGEVAALSVHVRSLAV